MRDVEEGLLLRAGELRLDVRGREPGEPLDVLKGIALLGQAHGVRQRPTRTGAGHAAHGHR